MRLASVTAAAALLLAACSAQPGAGSAPPSVGASAAPSTSAIQVTVAHTSAGDALAGPNGMTLYVFKNDANGTSTCTGGCATMWPPLLGDGTQVVAGAGVSGSFGTTTRDDGSKQVTHSGQPLYYFSGDQAAGDAKGDGVGGVWSIAPVGEASGGASVAPSMGAPGY